ncbi:chitin binding [Pelomyxa schiedti]|nr:chitin binding [Pelomyxa schiedti]
MLTPDSYVVLPLRTDHDVTPIDCEGYAGTEESRWNTDNAKSIDDTYSLMPSKHLSMAICFDKKKWLSQLGALLLSATYDKIDAHVAVGSNFMCSLHPNVHYDYNPTQLWLGFPEDVVPTDLSRGKRLRFLRLPDSMTGLTLGFLMDMYGIPLTSDGGALQTSKTVLSDLVSIIPQRLKVPSAEGRPNNTKQPDYQSHQYFESNPNFDAYFAELSFAPLYKSLIVTALEMHAHHSPLFLFDCLGMRPIWNVLSRTSMDSLEFSFAIHAHKVGLFDTSLRYENVMQCLTSSNLTSKSFEQCVFSSTYTQIDRVRALCKIFDSSTLIYDYPIYWTDVELFITRLRSTYPFSTVEMHGTILWDTLSRDSLTAFQVLAEHRQIFILEILE